MSAQQNVFTQHTHTHTRIRGLSGIRMEVRTEKYTRPTIITRI